MAMKSRVGLPLAALLLVPALAAGQALPKPAQPAPAAADFVAPGTVVRLPAHVAAATESVKAENLATHIRLLASPSLEGRGLGRQGLEAAAEYVAASLALAGIPPLGGDRSAAGYFQSVPIREISRQAGQVTIEGGADGTRISRTFSSGVDCVFPEVAPQLLSGPVVLAGYGIREPSIGRDDYRGLDVRGKIVVVMGGVPAGGDWQKPEMVGRYGAKTGRARYAAKLETAAALGATAVLGVEGAEFAAMLAGSRPAPPYFLGADEAPDALPLILVTPAVAGAIAPAEVATAAGIDKPRALPGVAATIRVSGDVRAVLGRNVIAVIGGTDPKVRDEAVILGAHVDHLGRSGESMYPGADDNASGVAALIEIAKAYAASEKKPRRTVVFAFWTGEEEGHLGSEYYARHPLWPMERTAAYANLDMIAHPWLPDEIKKLVAESKLPRGEEFVARVKPADFVEPGVAEWAPELCTVLAQAARGLGLALHFDRTDGRSGGSDYRAFARKGVRFIRFFGNYFPGYHEPTDTPDATDATQALKIARLALATTWLLADQ